MAGKPPKTNDFGVRSKVDPGPSFKGSWAHLDGPNVIFYILTFCRPTPKITMPQGADCLCNQRYLSNRCHFRGFRARGGPRGAENWPNNPGSALYVQEGLWQPSDPLRSCSQNQILRVRFPVYSPPLHGGFCRKKHRCKNTIPKIGPGRQETRPETKGKRPNTSSKPLPYSPSLQYVYTARLDSQRIGHYGKGADTETL